MGKRYLSFTIHEKIVRKRSIILWKLYMKAAKIDEEKAGAIMNKLADPYKPISYEIAVRELKRIIYSRHKSRF